MNNLKLKIPMVSPCLSMAALPLLGDRGVITHTLPSDWLDVIPVFENRGCVSVRGHTEIPTPVLYPRSMSLREWFGYWPGSDVYTDDQYFTQSFPHSFHMDELIYEPTRLIDCYVTN